MKKLKVLLKKDIETLVDLGNDWLEPTLYMKEKNKPEIAITIQSGEYENKFGEFFFIPNTLTDKQLAIAEELIREIADENSIEPNFDDSKWTKFTLNEEYLEKLKSL